jgi:hypothetical protein
MNFRPPFIKKDSKEEGHLLPLSKKALLDKKKPKLKE